MQIELKKIAFIFNGKTPSKDQQRESGFPVLKIKDIDDRGFFKGKFDSFIDNQFAEKLKGKYTRVGDTLILNAAHNSDYVGTKKCFVSEEFSDVLATGEWAVVRPNIERVIPRYLFFILNSPGFQFSLKNVVKGIHLYPKDLERIQVYCPSLEDQKRIVKVLDEADALRQKRKQVIGLLDDYMKSVFLEMFGQKSPGYESWQLVRLKEITKKSKGSMRTGPFGSDLLHSEFVDSGVAVIGIDNAVQNKFAWDQRRFITQKKYEKLKRYTLFPKDIIITIMGTVGRTAVIPEDIPLAINTKHLAALTLDHNLANPYFISYSMHSNPLVANQICHQGRGAIMTGLNLGIIKELQIKLPPVKKQNEFELILKKSEAIKHIMFVQLEELKNQFQALMQKAFKGEL
jgi:type I restriction enzyme, S subunit